MDLAYTINTNQSQVQICSGGGFFCTINNHTLVSSVLAALVTLVLGFAAAWRLEHGRPGKLQAVFEGFIGYVRDMTHDTVSPEADFIVPIACTIGFFILVANWLDFFPLTGPLQPANSDWNLTLAMALVVWIVVQFYSIRLQGWGYFRKFTKPFDLPLWVRLLPIVIFINLVEELIKPVTLSLRLFGNILAGVVMVQLLPQLIPTGLNVVALAIWKAFDVFFIGTIQAFIFLLLTIIYFHMAREGMDEEEHGTAAVAAAH